MVAKASAPGKWTTKTEKCLWKKRGEGEAYRASINAWVCLYVLPIMVLNGPEGIVLYIVARIQLDLLLSIHGIVLLECFLVFGL